MPDLEAVGDAATGAVLGGTVEPRTGQPADGHTHEQSCLNCGAQLAGDYCHVCGQKAHAHRTLSGFWHDLVHGVLHFEGKIWQTLPLLAWKPGDLTRRYIHGQRARFVSPIALFLFSVFLMFAIASATGGVAKVDSDKMQAELMQEALKSDALIKRLLERKAAAQAAGQSTAAIDKAIEDARSEAGLQREIVRSGLVRGTAVRMSDDVPAWMAGPVRKAAENPELLIYKLKTNAYKFSWALIPLSVPFMWLLFPLSRRFRLYDHTVFVTYSLSFMTLLVVTALLLGAAGLGSIASLAFLVPPIHMYVQLKGAYGLSRLGALWRTVLLVTFAFVTVMLFVLLLVGVGVLD